MLPVHLGLGFTVLPVHLGSGFTEPPVHLGLGFLCILGLGFAELPVHLLLMTNIMPHQDMLAPPLRKTRHTVPFTVDVMMRPSIVPDRPRLSRYFAVYRRVFDV